MVDKTDREVPDHMGVLENIYNKILKLSAESYGMSTMAVMTETETKVLSLWGKHKWRHYPTFAGYDAFTENSPAVIVGDLALIKSYLYGDVDIEGKNEAINKFKEGATKQALKNAKNAVTVGLGLFGLTDSSDALEELKTDRRTSDIPVMIVSGKDLTSDQQRYLNQTAATVLQKGRFSGKELVNQIVEMLDNDNDSSHEAYEEKVATPDEEETII